MKKSEYDRLYQAYCRTTAQEQYSEQSYEQTIKRKQQKWADFGREKAKEYSSIPFEEFAKRLLKEISVGASYIPNAIAILFVGGGAIGMLTILPKAAGLGYLAYRLFLVAQADYKEERKRKILNNK